MSAVRKLCVGTCALVGLATIVIIGTLTIAFSVMGDEDRR